jgi:hypothetical protein
MTDVSFMTVISATCISRFLSPPELYRLGQYLRAALRDPDDRDAWLDWTADVDAYALWQGLDVGEDARREPLTRADGAVMEMTHLTDGGYES